MPLQFVKTEDGEGIKVNDKGLPLVVDDAKEGAEPFAIDPINLYTQVPALRNEAASHRKEKEKALSKLKLFEEVGIELPDDDELLSETVKQLSEAAETVKNLKDGELIKAGEVETIKRQAQEGLQKQLDSQKASFAKKIEDLEKQLDDRDGTIKQLLVDNQFSTSKFVQEQLAMNSKVALAYFGSCFKIEKGEDGNYRVFGYYPDSGERIYSRERPGEPADFDEALSLIVEKDPARDDLLVGTGASGSGASGSGGGSGGGSEKNPFSKEHFNLTEQNRLAAEEPEKAARLARAAGIELYP